MDLLRLAKLADSIERLTAELHEQRTANLATKQDVASAKQEILTALGNIGDLSSLTAQLKTATDGLAAAVATGKKPFPS